MYTTNYKERLKTNYNDFIENLVEKRKQITETMI